MKLCFTVCRGNSFIDLNIAGEWVGNWAGKQVTTLVLALLKGHITMANELLKEDKIDWISPYQETGDTPLHLAIQRHYQACVKGLVDKVEIKEINKNTQCALSIKNKKERSLCHVTTLYNNYDAGSVQLSV